MELVLIQSLGKVSFCCSHDSKPDHPSCKEATLCDMKAHGLKIASSVAIFKSTKT